MTDQQLVLMKRGEATMYVPVSKFEQYKADGWTEISRNAPAGSVEPAAEMPIPSVEKAVERLKTPRAK